MTQTEAEWLISSILSRFGADSGQSIKDVKVATDRTDTLFEVPNSESYLVEITFK